MQLRLMKKALSVKIFFFFMTENIFKFQLVTVVFDQKEKNEKNLFPFFSINCVHSITKEFFKFFYEIMRFRALWVSNKKNELRPIGPE